MKLRNAIFYVKDIEKSKDFYKSIGFEVEKDFGKFISFKGNSLGGSLAIAIADGPEKLPGKQVASFIVEGIDDLYAEISKRDSIEIVQKLTTVNYGKVFFFRDIDGNKIEYVQETNKSNYISVKVSVIVILMEKNQVFLFKRKNTGWADGDYTVPSGHVDIGETSLEAAIREAKEETGAEISANNLEMIHSDFISGEIVNFTFIAKDWIGEPKVIEEDKAEDGEWFDLDNLPDNIAGHGKTILENIRNNVIYHEIK